MADISSIAVGGVTYAIKDETARSSVETAVGAVANKADKSSVVTATLEAASWADGVYELAVDGVTETSNQEVLPGLDITSEQLTALQGANIQDGGQSSGAIILKAFGDVPTIDIPIRVIVRGDM